jgi:hypothetical protein
VEVAEYLFSPLPPVAEERLLDRKRRTIWRNADRNKAIAKLATAFAADSIRPLHEMGTLLDAEGIDVAVSAGIDILVETLEHAGTLAAVLPQARVNAYGANRRARRQAEVGTSPISITTILSAYKDRGYRPSVLINAIGGPHALDLFTPQELDDRLILELADEYDEVARRDFYRRLGGYLIGCFHLPSRWQRKHGLHNTELRPEVRAAPTAAH